MLEFEELSEITYVLLWYCLWSPSFVLFFLQSSSFSTYFSFVSACVCFFSLLSLVTISLSLGLRMYFFKPFFFFFSSYLFFKLFCFILFYIPPFFFFFPNLTFYPILPGWQKYPKAIKESRAGLCTFSCFCFAAGSGFKEHLLAAAQGWSGGVRHQRSGGAAVLLRNGRLPVRHNTFAMHRMALCWTLISLFLEFLKD